VIRLQLVQAGFYDARAIAVFFAARLAGAVVLGIGGLLATPLVRPSLTGPNLWMTAAGLAILGYFGPTIYVKRRIARRVDQHRNGFPDFMDLMVVCSEAGLSMEAAIERIARELVEGYPSLAENLYMASLEIRAGKSFTEALERLGQRLAIEEAAMLATLLQQSIELGTSLSQSLRVYSDEMRNKRMSRAEEKAYALPAKLVVPLTLFVFPVLIVTLMFPAVIRVMGALSAGQ
jgi:tight adherence protein C